MDEYFNCPECSGKVRYSDELCPHCGSVLSSDSEVPPPLPEDDEFAELDYRPKAKRGLIIPLVVITVVVLFGAVAMNYWVNSEPDPAIDNPGEVIPDVEQEQIPKDRETEDEVVEEAETEEKSAEEMLLEPLTPPDYNFLEPGMHRWLVERTGDGDVILLHTDELEDVEYFFERFDIVEDNIIVYMIESKDEQFVTVLFGMPFSEWSTRVVFIWLDDQWLFLREVEVN